MLKKFYKLVHSEVEITGGKDGLAQAELVKELYLDKTRHEKYINYFVSFGANVIDNDTKFPEFDLELEYVKIRRGAKITDYIYFAPSFHHRFLASDKVQKILNKHNLPPFKLYKTELYKDNIKIIGDYRFLYVPSFGYDFIDFKASIFSTGNKRIGKKDFTVNSQEEFLSSIQPLNREKIVLNNNFDSNLDYFNLQILPETIISERLKEEFVKQNITGVEAVEFDLVIKQ